MTMTLLPQSQHQMNIISHHCLVIILLLLLLSWGINCIEGPQQQLLALDFMIIDTFWVIYQKHHSTQFVKRYHRQLNRQLRAQGPTVQRQWVHEKLS